MNRKTNILILLVGLALPQVLQAASYSVFSGQSIQAKIDAASNGDTVAIFGGSYTENLTVSKDVRLQLVSGQNVTLAGNITFSGLSNAYTFANFTWGGQTDKTITVNDCRNFTINSIKSPAGSISLTGSNTVAKIFATSLTNGVITVSGGANVQGIQSSCTGITVNGSSAADFARCTVTGNVSVASGVKRVSVSRCSVTEVLDSSSELTYVTYSSLRVFRQRGAVGKAYIVGCTIREDFDKDGWGNFGGNTVELHDTSSLSILNSAVRDGRDDYAENQAIWVAGGANLFAMNSVIYNYTGYRGTGRVFRLDGSATNYISSNIGYSIQNEFVYGPFANNTVNYNLSQTGEGGGVLLQNRLNADPAFVDTTNFVLGPTSPARNAGDPDPRFNDIDGTRNDMGIYGGPFYDPEGRTGSKPVVMQMELDQTQFLRGDYSTLKLKAVGSATGTAP
jgi:hypothetical protein